MPLEKHMPEKVPVFPAWNYWYWIVIVLLLLMILFFLFITNRFA